jgi:hypothetical protein
MCIQCDHGISGEALDDVVRARISLHGWVVLGIEGGGLCYTVGLTERGWPELVVKRMSENSGAVLLNTIVGMCSEDSPPHVGKGLMVRAPEDAPVGLHGLPMLLHTYSNTRGMAMARRLYRQGFRALEVVPDHSIPPVVK